MISRYSGKTCKLFLLAFIAAGICLLPLVAQQEKTERAAGKSERAKTTSESVVEAKTDVKEDFLPDLEENQEFLPELYRCSECGYEQDEEGYCPDHTEIELIKILSRGRNPLEPSELDGNEDIIVDIPLRGLKFRKTPVATSSEKLP